MKLLFLEPFFGGSHREFAKGWIAHSRHRFDLLTLPARFWKWRLRGAALYFARRRRELGGYDGLVVSDLMSLADFKGLVSAPCPPTLAYFHENQITYPLAPGEKPDYQYGFTNITTALAADRVLFNSRTHRRAFLEALPSFIAMMPEYRPGWITAHIRERSGVLHPGCRFPAGPPRLRAPDSTPPLIVWNHRWEFDKDPAAFFRALDAVRERGLEFNLALLGENFQVVPKEFIAARERYGRRIVQYGYVASHRAYIDWLRRGSIVISTARQENFGMAVVEAIRCGCLPLLPARLSYPEVLPGRFHADFLYRDGADLIERLAALLTDYPAWAGRREELALAMGRWAWASVVGAYDDELERLAARGACTAGSHRPRTEPVPGMANRTADRS